MRKASMMHLNQSGDDDLCRCARSVPICKRMDVDLLSCATTLLSPWRRPALRNTLFFASNWPKDGVRSLGAYLVKVASTVGPCSEIDESSTHYVRHMRLGSGAGSASAVGIHGKQDQGNTAEGRDAGEGGSRDPAGQPAHRPVERVREGADPHRQEAWLRHP